MRNLLTTVKTWGHKTFLALRAFEEAMDYRYEDHAQARFERLEQRVVTLEKQLDRPALPKPIQH